MKISPNFTLLEAIRSSTAARNGFDNTPKAKDLINIVHTAISMELVRSLFGGRPVTPSSWFRSLKVNRKVGSADTSDHITGNAVDFTIQGISNREVFNRIRSSGIKYKTLILEFEDSKTGGWIHIAFPKVGQSLPRKNLIATRENNQTIYKHV